MRTRPRNRRQNGGNPPATPAPITNPRPAVNPAPQISGPVDYWENSIILLGVSLLLMMFYIYLQADYFFGVGEFVGFQFAFFGYLVQVILSVKVVQMRITPRLWTPGFIIEAMIIGLGMAVLFTAFSNGELREYVIPHPIGIIIFLIFFFPEVEEFLINKISNFCENNKIGIYIYWTILGVHLTSLGYYLIQVFG